MPAKDTSASDLNQLDAFVNAPLPDDVFVPDQDLLDALAQLGVQPPARQAPPPPAPKNYRQALTPAQKNANYQQGQRNKTAQAVAQTRAAAVAQAAQVRAQGQVQAAQVRTQGAAQVAQARAQGQAAQGNARVLAAQINAQNRANLQNQRILAQNQRQVLMQQTSQARLAAAQARQQGLMQQRAQQQQAQQQQKLNQKIGQVATTQAANALDGFRRFRDRIANTPTPGGIAALLGIQLLLILFLLPVNGYPRIVWLWLALTRHAALQGEDVSGGLPAAIEQAAAQSVLKDIEQTIAADVTGIETGLSGLGIDIANNLKRYLP